MVAVALRMKIRHLHRLLVDQVLAIEFFLFFVIFSSVRISHRRRLSSGIYLMHLFGVAVFVVDVCFRIVVVEQCIGTILRVLLWC